MRASKDHEIRTKNEEHTAQSDEKCPVHRDKSIEVYCPDDDTLGCLLCFTDGHKSCKNVALISDLSRETLSSKVVSDLNTKYERYKTLADEYNLAIGECRSCNNEWHTKSGEGINQLQLQILDYVQKLAEKRTEEVATLKEDNERQLNTLEENIKLFSEKHQSAMLEIDEHIRHNRNKQFFVALKRNDRMITQSIQQIEQFYQNTEIKKFELHTFNTDPSIYKTVDVSNRINATTTLLPTLMCVNATKAGKDRTSSPAATFISTSKIHIKTLEDSQSCFISGILELSANRLILADYQNSCLKLLDLKSSTVIKRKPLKSKPRDVTKLSCVCIAVSCPEAKQIHLLTADHNLDTVDTLPVAGECLGLSCTGDKFVVSYTTPKPQVQILNLKGKVLQSIQHDPSENMFANPRYVTLSPEQNVIYISDFDKNTVSCVNTTGIIQWVYSNKELDGPLGIATGDAGSLYICSKKNHIIHVVSREGARLSDIQKSQSGFETPFAICYSSHYRALFVSSAQPNHEDLNHLRRLSLQ